MYRFCLIQQPGSPKFGCLQVLELFTRRHNLLCRPIPHARVVSSIDTQENSGGISARFSLEGRLRHWTLVITDLRKEWMTWGLTPFNLSFPAQTSLKLFNVRTRI